MQLAKEILLSALIFFSGCLAIGGTAALFGKDFWFNPKKFKVVSLLVISVAWMTTGTGFYSLAVDWTMASYALYGFGLQTLLTWVAIAFAGAAEGVGIKDIKNEFQRRRTAYVQPVSSLPPEPATAVQRINSTAAPDRPTSYRLIRKIIGYAIFLIPPLALLIVSAGFYLVFSIIMSPMRPIAMEHTEPRWGEALALGGIVVAFFVGLLLGRRLITRLLNGGALEAAQSYRIGSRMYWGSGVFFSFWLVLSIVGIVPFGNLWIAVAGICLLLVHFGPQLMKPFANMDAEQVQNRDSRPPVLYLRSFQRESRTAVWGHMWLALKSMIAMLNAFRMAFETNDSKVVDDYFDKVNRGRSIRGPLSGRNIAQSLVSGRGMLFDEQLILANVMDRIGPYISISRPGEKSTWSDVGAAKRQMKMVEWQASVAQLIRESAAIVIEAGTTEGLIWEIRTVVRQVPGTKVLLLAPRTDKEYEQFCRFTGDIFPHELPAERPLSRLIMFRGDWRPFVLDRYAAFGDAVFDEPSCLNTFGPFIEQNSFGALFQSNVHALGR